MWPPEQWEDVMFSNEITFHVVNFSGTKVRRPSGDSRYKQQRTIPAMKHSANVRVWGYFSGKGGEEAFTSF
jgi:hypothetical protein